MITRFAPVVVTALVLASPALAQMSGLYTVDPAGSGPRNFSDARDASLRLTRQGVSGPVVLEFASGSYTYTLFVAPMPGASATNTVTFKSKVRYGAVFHHTSRVANVLPNGIIIDGFSPSLPAEHLVIDGFVFRDTSGGAHRQIRSYQFADDIEVKNCRFENGIMSVTSPQFFPSRNWRIHHNDFNNGSGIDVEGFAIHHNRFGIISRAMTLCGGADPRNRGRFYNNVVVSRSSGYALDLEGSANIDIEHNTIVSTGGGCMHVDGKFGLDIQVNNNIIVGATSRPAILMERGPKRRFFFDGNLHWNPVSKKIAWAGTNGIAYNLAEWRTQFGHEAHGLFADPKFEAGKQSLRVGSPAAEAAWMTRPYVTDDFTGKARAAKPTIGAYEGDKGPPPTTFTKFGVGCAGAGGRVPAMDYTGDLRLGSTNFTVTLANARGGVLVPGFLAIGASRTTWNGVGLPLQLGGGCSINVSLDILTRQTVSGASGAGSGRASVLLPIPNDPRLKGVSLHFQWGVLDPAAAAIGVAFSDGGVLRI